MNRDQFVNLIQSAGKIGGTILVAQGKVSSENWEMIVGGAIALTSLWHSHQTSGDDAPKSQGGGVSPLKTLLLASLMPFLFVTACMTQKTPVVTALTNTVNGVSTTNFTTNVVTTVNAANLALDCAAIQALTGTAVSVAVAEDPAAKPLLLDIQTGITGLVSGANTNSVSQLAGLFGSTTNAAVVKNLAPIVSSASSLEQSLIAKYGASVGGQIGLAIVTGIANGITAGL